MVIVKKDGIIAMSEHYLLMLCDQLLHNILLRNLIECPYIIPTNAVNYSKMLIKLIISLRLSKWSGSLVVSFHTKLVGGMDALA